MARQATTPVSFNRSTRSDTAVTMTSGRAGKVIPLTYIPLLRGDSCAGRVGVDIDLAEMPRPLLNGVTANVQAWFVPKSAHPQFSGPDEFNHAYMGQTIKALGQADRTPPPFYHEVDGASLTTVAASDFFKTLGLHVPTGSKINADLIDAFNLIYNFRLAAHSSRLTRKDYFAENVANSVALPRAFWPSGRFSRVVPDYERALIVGSLDLDVQSGQIPIRGLGIRNAAGNVQTGMTSIRTYDPSGVNSEVTWNGWTISGPATGTQSIVVQENPDRVNWPRIYGEMGGETVGVTLADIDKARTTQAFARLRTAYAGNDATGFDNDDVIVAHLMQGLAVPADQFKRPWLLDQKRVPFGFSERHALDGASLDQSVSEGRASAMLSLNVPANDVGGVIMITLEVLPERLDERQSDEWLMITDTDQLPNALRDVQRPEPVDLVLNRRLDAKHTTPGGLYGYEPMNDKWNRAATRLGGAFYQSNPLAPWTEQRSAIWQTSIVDPEFTDDHYLVPAAFPHDVFSDTTAPAFEVVVRHAATIVGLTQIGDVLAEDNSDYEAVALPADE